MSVEEETVEKGFYQKKLSKGKFKLTAFCFSYLEQILTNQS